MDEKKIVLKLRKRINQINRTGSCAVVVPKAFMDANGLKPKDMVVMELLDDGTLRIEKE